MFALSDLVRTFSKNQFTEDIHENPVCCSPCPSRLCDFSVSAAVGQLILGPIRSTLSFILCSFSEFETTPSTIKYSLQVILLCLSEHAIDT